ncbi:hypothetical protein FRB90_003003 [Tulasnella sp. 427]|nr:hypothetical protein FRB90_003003 [Tulasnella sp. 427]
MRHAMVIIISLNHNIVLLDSSFSTTSSPLLHHFGCSRPLRGFQRSLVGKGVQEGMAPVGGILLHLAIMKSYDVGRAWICYLDSVWVIFVGILNLLMVKLLKGLDYASGCTVRDLKVIGPVECKLKSAQDRLFAPGDESTLLTPLSEKEVATHWSPPLSATPSVLKRVSCRANLSQTRLQTTGLTHEELEKKVEEILNYVDELCDHAGISLQVERNPRAAPEAGDGFHKSACAVAVSTCLEEIEENSEDDPSVDLNQPRKVYNLTNLSIGEHGDDKQEEVEKIKNLETETPSASQSRVGSLALRTSKLPIPSRLLSSTTAAKATSEVAKFITKPLRRVSHRGGLPNEFSNPTPALPSTSIVIFEPGSSCIPRHAFKEGHSSDDAPRGSRLRRLLGFKTRGNSNKVTFSEVVVVTLFPTSTWDKLARKKWVSEEEEVMIEWSWSQSVGKQPKGED